nr:hypothetical protein [Deltaproteobacteria bacterium]
MPAKKLLVLFLIAASFLDTFPDSAWSADTADIPPSLKQWEGWVLHNLEERLCPTRYNDGESYQCTWPSRVVLNLEDTKGSFSQEWLVFAETDVPLPGSPDAWPEGVTVDGRAVPVIARDGAPSVFLAPGARRVEGSFVWNEMPETINVPPESGLVSLTLNGTPVPFPFLENDGRLWLKRKEDVAQPESRVEHRVFRLINDTIPMQVVNLFRIDISGRPREVVLKKVLLEGAVPMKIDSPLPARLGTDGELVIQARPGRWDVEVTTRFKGPVESLTPITDAPAEEVWSFQAQNHLRMVKIEGVSPIDPKQTDVPVAWQNFPAFIMAAQSEMVFKVLRRGDPEPAPDQLYLYRTWWLDFDGSGFTVKDTISGALSRQWYLAMNPPNRLERVTVEGVDQLITGQGPEEKPGVELRKGHLQLEAESRLEGGRGTIPAVSWDHDVQSLSGVLNLPPGWRLLTVTGVDDAKGTWFERWSLLDLFLVLIISLAVYRLWNWQWGVVTLFAVGLAFHEPDAPRLVWLHLLAALALLRFLPEGWARRVVNLWRFGSLVYLLIVALPFMVNQIRAGIYPQLETLLPVRFYGAGMPAVAPQEAALDNQQELKMAESMPAVPVPAEPEGRPLQRREKKLKAADKYRTLNALTQDPYALNQTGPGMPAWQWRTIPLFWNGPVASDQTIHLWLLSPVANLILAFLRTGLLAMVILLLVPLRVESLRRGKAVIGIFCLAFLLVPAPSRAQDVGYPSPELLQELQNRLLEKPDCLPACAASPRMLLTVSQDSIRILFDVHAAVETAVPLPGAMQEWKPENVLLDDRPAAGVATDKQGTLWALITAGVHTLTLYGKAPKENAFSIPLPLKPHHVEVEAAGWTVQGVNQDGQVEAASIQLTRTRENGLTNIAAATKIHPFFQLKRVLILGLTWQVQNTLIRMTPADTPVTLAVPLLDHESVTTPGIPVEDGRAIITLEAHDTEMTWTSSLKITSSLVLQSFKSVPWTEHWVLDISPIWHGKFSGLPVIHHQNKAGYWMPEWRPWPGENLSLMVYRPQAVEGPVLTIESAYLNMVPGKRYTTADLAFTVRTSKGGEHRVVVPQMAEVAAVTVENQGQPIKKEGMEVIVPLKPGLQNVQLSWRQPSSFGLITQVPAVSVGPRAVNADIVVQMQPSRWILWAHGPRLGPAVLFWSSVVIVILAALGLGSTSVTPLKRRDWLLLGLGLTQVHPAVALVIVGWFFALGLRNTRPASDHYLAFNATQLLLAVWTIAAGGALYVAVKEGLLGIPDMQIAGNGSSDFYLHWTQDRIGSFLPQPRIFSLPLIVFRILMLLWALWLAYSLLTWLRWAWHRFSEKGLWRKKTKLASPPPIG